MKVRSTLLLIAMTATLAPMTAGATHCDSPIYIFSSTRVQTDIDDPTNPEQKIGRGLPSAVSSAAGCTVVRDTVIAEEPPAEAHPLTDSDIVYPNSNRMFVRLLDNGNDPAIIVSASLEWAGEVYPLTMSQTVDVTGAPAAFLDSQTLVIDPADTLAANTATATLCITGGVCYERTYRTVVIA